MPRYYVKVDGRLFGDTHSTLRAAREAAEQLKASKPDSIIEVRGIRK